jgi:hypothetical protein
MKAAIAANPEWREFAKLASVLPPEVFKTVTDPLSTGTVFVPDNRAVSKFLQETNNTVDSIKADKNKTRDATAIISYHMVPGIGIDLPSLTDGRVLRTSLVVDKMPANIIVDRKKSADGKEAVELVGDLSSAFLYNRDETYAGADVLYTIDDVLVPELRGASVVGMSVMDVLRKQGFTTFVKMIERLQVS